MLDSYNPQAIVTVARQLQIQRVLAITGWLLFGLFGGCILAFSSLVFTGLSEGKSLAVIIASMVAAAIVGGARTMWLNAAAHSLLCYVAIEANTRQISIALQRLEIRQ